MLMSIAEFDMIPTDEFYVDMQVNLETVDPEPDELQSKMEPLGFESVWIVSNLGSISIIFGIFVLLLLVVLILDLIVSVCPCCPCISFINRKRRSLRYFTMWNWPISFLRDSYSVIAICCLYNVAYASHANREASLNSGLAIAILFCMVVYPAGL